MISAANELKEAMKRAAEAAFPKEACGCVTKAGLYVPYENIAEAPESNFRMDAGRLWQDDEVAAVFHSHPNGADAPSAADMQQQIETAVPWALCSVNADGTATEPYFWGTADCAPPLLGRSFRHGPSGTDGRGDCYALIRDYFRQERHIGLPEFPRSDGWWNEEGFDLYTDHFREAGFSEITMKEARAGDVFMARVLSDKINHAGVLLEGGLILHHLSGRLSVTQPLGRWVKLIARWTRYNE